MDMFKDWVTTFWKVVIKPVPETFVNEASKAKGKFSSAVAWLSFLAVLIHLSVFLLFDYVYPLWVTISTILFVPITFLVFVFFTHLFYQRLFHRKKDYQAEFLYLTVGISVPFVVIGSIVPVVPQIGTTLAWISLLYPIILMIIAVRAITKLYVWQATVTVFLGLFFSVLGFLCLPVFFFSMMNAVPGVLY